MSGAEPAGQQQDAPFSELFPVTGVSRAERVVRLWLVSCESLSSGSAALWRSFPSQRRIARLASDLAADLGALLRRCSPVWVGALEHARVGVCYNLWLLSLILLQDVVQCEFISCSCISNTLN